MIHPTAMSDLSFEKSVEQLQKTLKALESGELGLEQSLKEFEAGVATIRKLQESLKAAEQKVDALTRVEADGRAVTEPSSTPKNS